MSLVHLEHVSHSYGRLEALKDVQLDLEPGAIGLVGRNGAGKSTLLKIVLGILRPSRGRGTVLGFDIHRQPRELRAYVGFMPEGETIIPGVRGVDLVALAGELSGMARKQARRRAHETLSYLELEEARYRRCEEYSVGMLQRLKLAAALVHDPPLLLLDEPTAGLDPEGRDAMLRLLRGVVEKHNKSLILSTHLLGDVERVCQRVIILEQGRILGVGALRELCKGQPGRYRLQVWGSQIDAFMELMRAHGAVVHTAARKDEIVVEVSGKAWPTYRFFELSRQAGIVLRGIVPEEEDLKQHFHRIMRHQFQTN